MSAPYQHQQQQQQQQPDFEQYRHHQWPVDRKPACVEEDEMSLLDEEILEPTTPAELATDRDAQNSSLDQPRHNFSPRTDMWHSPSQQISYQQPHQQVHASTPMIDTSCNQYPRLDMAREGTYDNRVSWPASAMSAASTPTPIFDHTGQEFHAMAYHGGQVNFNQPPYPADPFSATAMSPQSSQGGWMSATSSDGTEPCSSQPMRSPDYRAASPASHMRQDGIRKKNARFEIPAERNLGNIDSLILQSADEHEKKELKQQKRLLRNRQAALDSRQRKKHHTETLEQEKKEFNQHLSDLQDENRQLQEALQRETAIRHHQQQEYEHFIQNVSFERDEAIRTKTLETAELRKMNKILKDHIRDYDRREYERQSSSQDINGQTGFANELSSFDELDMEDDTWDDSFLVINNDLNDRPNNVTPTPQRQVAHNAAMEPKADAPFSWNAFYMCLLFGAFIASNSGSNSKPAVPSLSEEYRAESANVLNAVLTAGPDNLSGLAFSPHGSKTNAPSQAPAAAPAVPSGPEMARTTGGPKDNLGALHHSLTTPSRRQRETAAFSLSAASYQHLTNPDPLLSSTEAPGDGSFEAKPSRLETAFSALQESRQEIDKVMNRGPNERSLMWERVPEKVLRDFRSMIENTKMGR